MAAKLNYGQSKRMPDWKTLPSSTQEFYKQLADLEYLKSDYEQTQMFFEDRIHKIKSDSHNYFNEYTVGQAVQEFAESNPARVMTGQPHYEPINSDFYNFMEPFDQ